MSEFLEKLFWEVVSEGIILHFGWRIKALHDHIETNKIQFLKISRDATARKTFDSTTGNKGVRPLFFTLEKTWFLNFLVLAQLSINSRRQESIEIFHIAVRFKYKAYKYQIIFCFLYSLWWGFEQNAAALSF